MSQSSPYPESPCVGLCQLDRVSGHCIGCGRTLDEIGHWVGMDVERKREVIALAAARLGGEQPAPRRRDGSA
ncbi:MAG: DUF1289 domain-containing protein [Ectothiorhodospiraceae bacterium]|nr:DUF1289 domain-containing protein [Ectothiorhodospiraceae bacterium]